MTSAYVDAGDAILATYKRAPMRIVRGEVSGHHRRYFDRHGCLRKTIRVNRFVGAH